MKTTAAFFLNQFFSKLPSLQEVPFLSSNGTLEIRAYWTKDRDRGSGGDGDDNFLHRLDEVWEGVRGSGQSQLFRIVKKKLSECLCLQQAQVYWPSFCYFFPLSDSRAI